MSEYPDLPQDKSPPNSKEVEKAIIGNCLQFGNKVVAEVFDTLRPEMMYYDMHRKMLTAIQTVKDGGQEVDQVTVYEELNRTGDLESVGAHNVAAYSGEVATASNTVYLCGIAYDDYERRKVLTALQQAEPQIYDRSKSLESIVDPIRSNSTIRLSSSCELIGDLTADVVDEIEAAWKGEAKVGIRAQIDISNATTGGWFPGEFYVIAARPSVGKTALALLEAQHAKVPVWFVSAEMTKRLLIQRLLSNRTGISTTQMREGALQQQEHTNLLHGMEHLNKLPLYIEDSLKDVDKLADEARRMHEVHGVRMMVFDYLQLLTSEKHSQTRDREVAHISNTLKDIAKDLDIPVLALSQLSRAVEQRGGRPQLSDLRDSGTLEQDADVVIFLHRDGIMSKTVEIAVAKNRNGPLGMMDYKFNGLRGTFIEMQNEEEE